MNRVLVAFLVCSGCSSGTWISEATGERSKSDLCEVSRSFDLVARARLIRIGEARDLLFAWWPQSSLRVTELTIEVDEALRGGTGRMSVLISAPERAGKLHASDRVTAVGEAGWVLGALLEHADGSGASMLLDASGFGLDTAEKVSFEWFGTYDKASVRAQFERLPGTCARGRHGDGGDGREDGGR